MTDTFALIRSLGALLTVLGLLGAALWAVRRYNLVLPGGAMTRTDRRLAIVDRLSIDPRRSLALIRRDGVEHLVLLAPEGHILVESRIVDADRSTAVEATAQAPPASILPAVTAPLIGRFGALVDRTRGTASPPRAAVTPNRPRARKGRGNRG